jgi:hypothetical protein
MEGFKKLPKMQFFKDGGFVKRKEVTIKPIAKETLPKEKATGKKPAGFLKEAKEEIVDVSTLKKGGRAKKKEGTVKKFQKAETVIGMKKTAEDKKQIAQIKDTKVVKKKEGGKIKKMADGKLTAEIEPVKVKKSDVVRNRPVTGSKPRWWDDRPKTTGPTGPVVDPKPPRPTGPVIDPVDPNMTGTTQPPVTQPPVTQPPVTQPPVTQPPVTQPPVTQPPVNQPPVVQAPVNPQGPPQMNGQFAAMKRGGKTKGRK